MSILNLPVYLKELQLSKTKMWKWLKYVMLLGYIYCYFGIVRYCQLFGSYLHIMLYYSRLQTRPPGSGAKIQVSIQMKLVFKRFDRCANVNCEQSHTHSCNTYS